ncbi:MAG TPA: hypothetical protein VK491_02040, partial [Gemmatimonadaceae bacterium]|nr:hypothetical protein [Gemmatimonadaceae bacterium]
MNRPPTATHSARQYTRRRVHVMLLGVVLIGACVHSPGVVRPARRINYWEALAELYPMEAVGAAHTDSERRFAQALANLMDGDLEKAEQGFADLRT